MKTKKTKVEALLSSAPAKAAETEFCKLYKAAASARYVHENMLEYGLPYSPEDNAWKNFELKDVVKKETPKAFLVNIERFKGELFNGKDIWVPKSACVYVGRNVLEIEDWLLQAKNEELKSK